MHSPVSRFSALCRHCTATQSSCATKRGSRTRAFEGWKRSQVARKPCPCRKAPSCPRYSSLIDHDKLVVNRHHALWISVLHRVEQAPGGVRIRLRQKVHLILFLGTS